MREILEQLIYTYRTLESVGINVDPRSQTLKRLPATRLKKLMPKI